MKKLRGNKGFGLVECVVAMFLFCIVMLGLANHLGATMTAMQADKTTSVASALLQDKVEAIKHTPYGSISSGGDSISKNGFSFTRTWNVTISGNMKTVALSIAWNGRTMNTSMVLAQ
jgi:prepilin-type N-terminal cleavage/methylation domain-containing protein